MAPRSFDLAPFRTAVLERICSFCIDGNDDGTCNRPKTSPCALVTHLEQIVRAVIAVGGKPDLGEYVARLRSEVCPTCRQDARGLCALRSLAECSVDAYLIPVIEVIEEVARGRGLLRPLSRPVG